MSESYSPHDDEIDLFELVATLWAGRWVFVGYLGSALAIGFAALISATPEYSSRIALTPHLLPPFYEEPKVRDDFRRIFFDEAFFNAWQVASEERFLVYGDFSHRDDLDGFSFTRDRGLRLATFEASSTGDFSLLAKTRDRPVLDALYRYARHANKAMTDQYRNRAEKEARLMDARLESCPPSDQSALMYLLNLDRYMDAAGEQLTLSVAYPTVPAKVGPGMGASLALYGALGGVAAICHILVSSALRRRKLTVSQQAEQ